MMFLCTSIYLVSYGPLILVMHVTATCWVC